MITKTITRNGREYQLIAHIARLNHMGAYTVKKLLSLGLPSVTMLGHVYINQQDFENFVTNMERAVPLAPDSVVIDGRVHHPMSWYSVYREAKSHEMTDLPYNMVGAIKYIAEDDFYKVFWWKEKRVKC